MMDSESQKQFDRIVRTEPAALSPGDIEFLKVRRSYLTASELERYGKLLGAPETEEDTETAKPGKKK